MRASLPFAPWCGFLLAAAFLFFGPGAGRSQDFKKNYDASAAVRDKLFSGEVQPNAEKRAKDIAQVCAEYFIELRLAKEFQANVSKIMDKNAEKRTVEFRKLYGPVLVGTMQEQFRLDIKADPGKTIHAAMMLPTMARLKEKEVNRYLVKLIEDSQTHDAVRLYALKALKETMPLEPQQELFGANSNGNWDFTSKEQNARRSQDARNVEALAKYIERTVKIDAMSADEIATLKYLRREAIVALAAAGTPAVYAFTKPPAKGVPLYDGLIAPTLMKVLIPGIIRPEPTLQEKVEAAVGLCAMDYTNMPEYRPEMAIYLVGQTIVEFSKEYNKDWPNFNAVGKGKLLPFVAWRTDAKRFQTGLNQLRDNAKGAKAAAVLQSQAKPLLDKIERSETVNLGQLQDCIVYVDKMRPKDGKIFKTLDVPPVPVK